MQFSQCRVTDQVSQPFVFGVFTQHTVKHYPHNKTNQGRSTGCLWFKVILKAFLCQPTTKRQILIFFIVLTMESDKSNEKINK